MAVDEVVGGLDVVGPEVEIDLVDAVARALVVDQGARAELGDGQETRARHELVASLALAAAGHIRRERQAREVVAGQEALRGEVAVGVEVAFVDAFGLGEQADLAFRLRAQPARVVALGLRPRMVANDLVVQLALADRGAIEAAPALAGGIESALDLVEDLSGPVVVEPGRRGEFVANAGDELVGLGERGGPMDRVPQFPRKASLTGSGSLPSADVRSRTVVSVLPRSGLATSIQIAWTWERTRSRLRRSMRGGATAPATILLGSRKKYWSCGLRPAQ